MRSSPSVQSSAADVAAVGNRVFRASRLADLAVILVIGLYCLYRYRSCICTFFFLDDFWILRDAAAIDHGSIQGLLQIFHPHVGFILYRPLTQVGYFYVLRLLFGLDASGYHATQLLVFTFNSVLVYAMAKRLTDSRTAGLATALLYAAAPGQTVAVFWLAAFTMTGSATAVLLMLLWWQHTDGPWRAAGSAILQAIALLCSEHTVTAPLLLALVGSLSPRPPPRRAILRSVLPGALVAGAYVAAKLVYLHSRPVFGYEMSLNPVLILDNLGRYTAAAVSTFRWLEFTPRLVPLVGCAVVLGALWATRRALTGHASWRLVAAGTGFFVVALAPVLPLINHYYSYFVGLAAFGAALAIVGACRLVAPRHWRALAAAAALIVVGSDFPTPQRATRDDQIFNLVVNSGLSAAAWITAVQRADARLVYLPRDRTTRTVFAMGHAERLFTEGSPPIVRWYGTLPPKDVGPDAAVLARPPLLHVGDPLPGWQPRWRLLRWLGCASTDCGAGVRQECG
jgi:hypothetical protein